MHLGPAERHTVYEGEAVGGILAAKLLQGQDIKIHEGISIYVDNQSVIAGAKKIHNRSGQYLLNGFHDALLQIPTVKLFARSNKLTIRWISAHTGVEGNEAVDILAKAAAAGKSSPEALLPQALITSKIGLDELPHNIAALKAQARTEIKARWFTR
ncbi:hypothetical protein BDN72DRAFT_781712, partial [Pluteus cervinus]